MLKKIRVEEHATHIVNWEKWERVLSARAASALNEFVVAVFTEPFCPAGGDQGPLKWLPFLILLYIRKAFADRRRVIILQAQLDIWDVIPSVFCSHVRS